MLQVFVRHEERLHFAKGADAPAFDPIPDAVWLDLLTPTPQETRRAEALMGLPLPTREQMAEIEESSRLRRLPNAQLMTVMALAWADTDRPQATPVTFIMTPDLLATLHYIDPQPILAFRRRVSHRGHPAVSAEQVLIALLEALIERTAVVLRRTVQELDTLGACSFRMETLRARTDEDDDARRLRRIGRAGQLIAKAHVCLTSLKQPLEFLRAAPQPGQPFVPSKALRQWAKGALQDVNGLDEYALFLNQKVGLLLDTTLGEITGEQNEIVRIVTVISTAMLPPTTVASVFGMNFHHAPGLMASPWGYAAALGLMAASIIAPLALFKRNGWL